MNSFEIIQSGDILIIKVEDIEVTFTDENVNGRKIELMTEDEADLLTLFLEKNGWITLSKMKDDLDFEEWELVGLDKGMKELIDDGLVMWCEINGVSWIKGTMELDHMLNEQQSLDNMFG